MKQRKSDNRMDQQRSETTGRSDQYHRQQRGYQPGGSESTGASRRPIYRRWWFWLLIVLALILIIAPLSQEGPSESGAETSNQTTSAEAAGVTDIPEASGGIESNETSGTVESLAPSNPSESAEDPATNGSASDQDPATKESVSDQGDPDDSIFVLNAGHYTAGIDLPSGRCDVRALSGEGNLSSTNMFSGGINEMFGIDDGSGFYTDSFTGLKLPEGTILSVGGTLSIEITYSSVEGGYSGRQYDEQHSIEMSSGNFIAGEDFPAGVYSIEAVSGQGNLSSSNMFSEGVNEMFGVDDGSGFYLPRIEHVKLSNGTELSASSGVTVRLIPCD